MASVPRQSGKNGSWTSPVRILVVDDQEPAGGFLERFLMALGFRVSVVPSAEQALDICRTEPPDLVLSDWCLGAGCVSGLGLLKTLRSSPQTKDLPFIMMSGIKDGPEHEERVRRNGGNLYLTKAEIMDPGRRREGFARIVLKLVLGRREAAAGAGRILRPDSRMPSPMRILLIEKENNGPPSRLPGLLKAGYLVMPATNGDTVVAWLRQPEKPDAVVIDCGEPDCGGFSLCQALKRNPETKNIPVVILGNGEDDCRKAQVAGADCCLGKTADPAELLKTLERLLQSGDARQRRGLLHRDGLELNPSDRSVFYNGKTSTLPDALFDVLYLLTAHWPQTVDRGSLAERVVPNGRAREVDVYVSRLRKKLREEFGLDFIDTLCRVGYRLALPGTSPGHSIAQVRPDLA